jgi:hypothetical protein
MHKLKAAVIAALFAAVALASAQGSAMPIGGLAASSKSFSIETQKVVWVCGWYRCWWRPVFVYPAPYVYARPYWGWPGAYWGWRRWYW